MVKENVKLFEKLKLKNEILAVNNKNIKTELNNLKNKKLLRNKKQQSNTSKTQNSDHIEDANHNILLSESSPMSLTSTM